MPAVSAKAPLGLDPGVRHRRAGMGIGVAGRAYRPLLIDRLPRPKDLRIGGAASREGAIRVRDACKFLFFPPRPASARSNLWPRVPILCCAAGCACK